MDLKKWKIFQNLDSTFLGNIQSAYIIDHAGARIGAAWAGTVVLNIERIFFPAGLNAWKSFL